MASFKELTKSRQGIVFIAFIWMFFLYTLDAYQFWGIPFSWIASSGLIISMFPLILKRTFFRLPGNRLLYLMITWMFIVTIYNLFANDYASLMPSSATTPYYAFILLRFSTVFVFLATICIVNALLTAGYKDMLIRYIVIIASAISLTAIYMYFATLYGLPIIQSNRIGTGGDFGISYTYSYAFHRATGLFREPSQLASWLVVPFFLSFLYRKTITDVHKLLIFTALLLTGSLTGIMGVFIGLIIAFVISNLFRLSNNKSFINIFIVLVLSMAFFGLLAKSYDADKINLIQVMYDRLEPLQEGGMAASNRYYIYDYIDDTTLPVFGNGIGNSNILLSNYLSIPAMASFLNLYFNFIYSSGIIGLVILICFILIPIRRIFIYRRRLKKNSKQVFFMLGAYVAWLIIFSVQAEELSLMFAVVYSFLIFETTKTDELVKSLKTVTPAKAGVQNCLIKLDSVSGTE